MNYLENFCIFLNNYSGLFFAFLKIRIQYDVNWYFISTVCGKYTQNDSEVLKC